MHPLKLSIHGANANQLGAGVRWTLLALLYDSSIPLAFHYYCTGLFRETIIVGPTEMNGIMIVEGLERGIEPTSSGSKNLCCSASNPHWTARHLAFFYLPRRYPSLYSGPRNVVVCWVVLFRSPIPVFFFEILLRRVGVSWVVGKKGSQAWMDPKAKPRPCGSWIFASMTSCV